MLEFPIRSRITEAPTSEDGRARPVVFIIGRDEDELVNCGLDREGVITTAVDPELISAWGSVVVVFADAIV